MSETRCLRIELLPATVGPLRTRRCLLNYVVKIHKSLNFLLYLYYSLLPVILFLCLLRRSQLFTTKTLLIKWPILILVGSVTFSFRITQTSVTVVIKFDFVSLFLLIFCLFGNHWRPCHHRSSDCVQIHSRILNPLPPRQFLEIIWTSFSLCLSVWFGLL